MTIGSLGVFDSFIEVCCGAMVRCSYEARFTGEGSVLSNFQLLACLLICSCWCLPHSSRLKRCYQSTQTSVNSFVWSPDFLKSIMYRFTCSLHFI